MCLIEVVTNGSLTHGLVENSYLEKRQIYRLYFRLKANNVQGKKSGIVRNDACKIADYLRYLR